LSYSSAFRSPARTDSNPSNTCAPPCSASVVNFLDYIGEPIKMQRQQLGIRVIGFLLVFLLIAYMLKREIWKDVH